MNGIPNGIVTPIDGTKLSMIAPQIFNPWCSTAPAPREPRVVMSFRRPGQEIRYPAYGRNYQIGRQPAVVA